MSGNGSYEDRKILQQEPELLRAVEQMEEVPDLAAEGTEILEDTIGFIRSYVLVTDAQAVVLGLWVLHTHVFYVFEFTPYLAITSPEKQCGKSRLLEVVELVTPRPWTTSHATPAVLVRKIHRVKPTLFLDELDAALGGPKEYVETLRGILDTGDQRNGVCSLCVKQGKDGVEKDFSTYCPKVLAAIKDLPGTVADRSLHIRLQRKPKDAQVKRLRYRQAAEEAKGLLERIKTWSKQQAKPLGSSRPKIPDELSDRQQDHAEVLLAIADRLAGEWPKRARAALVELCTSVHAEDTSPGVRLLTDIHDIFEQMKIDKLEADRVKSSELIAELAKIETSPWAEWGKRHKPITQTQLAWLLKHFDIFPRNVRFGRDDVAKGYLREFFEDAWKRYLLVDDPLPERFGYSDRAGGT